MSIPTPYEDLLRDAMANGLHALGARSRAASSSVNSLEEVKSAKKTQSKSHDSRSTLQSL